MIAKLIYRYRHRRAVRFAYLFRKAEKYRKLATAITDVSEALTNWLAAVDAHNEKARR